MREEWNRDEDLLFMFDAFCRKVIKFTGCAKRRDEKRKEDKMLSIKMPIECGIRIHGERSYGFKK